MICYRDKTFCVSETCPESDTCDRHLNVLNKSEFKRINIPLSMTDFQCDTAEQQTV